MCLFKRKKKEITIDSKYKIKESVRFRDRKGELSNGFIYDIHQKSDGTIIYDVQIGGECPVVIDEIPEDKIIPGKK